MGEIMINRYETDEFVSQYLLFHYGSREDQLPFSFGPREALDFPLRCVTECLDPKRLTKSAEALDLGCAVGRSSFELTRFCERVVAIDRSHAFISLAQQLQRTGELGYTIKMEGMEQVQRTARLPAGVFSDRVEFRCADVLEIKPEIFDVVLAANLLCRLAHPRKFLALLPQLVKPGGQLIMTTPLTWLEEFTPREHWLKREEIMEILQASFNLERVFDMPFLLREHLRMYCWEVALATVWIRK